VSRKHATLTRIGEGQFRISCHGANPVALDGGREVATNGTAEVKPGEKITISSYEIEIQ
jgi:hypothetical protein